MRYQDDGDFMPKIMNSFHQSLFGEVVQRAGCFIQKEYLRAMLQRTGKADALALSA